MSRHLLPAIYFTITDAPMIKNTCLYASILLFAVATWPVQAQTRPVVLGYSAMWRDGASPPRDYDWAGLTHIARAFLNPKPDGSIEVPDGYFNPSLETLAHQHDVKLLLSVGGGSGDAGRWVSLASDPQSRKKFVDGIGRLMKEHQYDGIDIDWEPPPSTPAEGVAYTSLLKALRAQFPQAVLTTALTTDEYSVKFFSWPDVIASVDYVNVMTYDYAGPWGGLAGHATNLHPAGDYQAIAEHSVEEGMLNLIQNHHVPPTKLLLGMNFWADRFRADHLGDHFLKNGDNASDNLSYQQVLDLAGTGNYQAKLDAKAAAPYLVRKEGGSVIVYDDPQSVRLKCEYAKTLGCAGVMIWNIGADECGTKMPLMDALVQSLGGRSETLGHEALQNQIVDVSEAIKRDGAALNPPVPSSLSSETNDQLDALLSRLNKTWGTVDDQHWHDLKATAAK